MNDHLVGIKLSGIIQVLERIAAALEAAVPPVPAPAPAPTETADLKVKHGK